MDLWQCLGGTYSSHYNHYDCPQWHPRQPQAPLGRDCHCDPFRSYQFRNGQFCLCLRTPLAAPRPDGIAHLWLCLYLPLWSACGHGLHCGDFHPYLGLGTPPEGHRYPIQCLVYIHGRGLVYLLSTHTDVDTPTPIQRTALGKMYDPYRQVLTDTRPTDPRHRTPLRQQAAAPLPAVLPQWRIRETTCCPLGLSLQVGQNKLPTTTVPYLYRDGGHLRTGHCQPDSLWKSRQIRY